MFIYRRQQRFDPEQWAGDCPRHLTRDILSHEADGTGKGAAVFWGRVAAAGDRTTRPVQ